MNDTAATPLSSGLPLERARRVIHRLADAGERIDSAREIPPDVMAMLHAARLFRLTLPHSLGGDATDLGTLAEVTEIISAADASTGWCIGQGSGCAMTAAQLPPDTARRVFGPADAILA